MSFYQDIVDERQGFYLDMGYDAISALNEAEDDAFEFVTLSHWRNLRLEARRLRLKNMEEKDGNLESDI